MMELPSLTDLFNRYIGRWVAFVITPFVALAVGFVALRLNKWLGVAVPVEVVTGYVVTTVVGAVAAIVKWLDGNVKWERGVLEMNTLHQSGAQAVQIAELQQQIARLTGARGMPGIEPEAIVGGVEPGTVDAGQEFPRKPTAGL